MLKSLIIYNPNAGKAQGHKYAQTLRSKLEELSHYVELIKSQGSEDIVLNARRSCQERFDFLFVLGGDGTINKALKGLKEEEKKPILGILPMGTGNLIAGGLNLTDSIDDLVENIREESYTYIDIGRVNNEVFAYMFSIGEVPKTVHETDEKSKEKLGQLAYFRDLISKGSDYLNFPMKISWDEDYVEGEFSHVVVSTSTQFRSLKFAEGANKNNDGFLNIYIFDPMSNLEILKLGLQALQGQVQKNENVVFFTAKKVKIEANLSNIPTDIDGDIGPDFPIEISVLPRFVRVLAKES